MRTKPRFLPLLAAAVGLAVGSGCGEPGPAAAHTSGRGRTLTVASFGGEYGNQSRLLLGDLIEATTGAQVEYVFGTSSQFLKQLRESKGSPAFDIVYLDGIVQDIAVREGLLDKVKDGELRFLDDLSSNALAHRDYGPGFQFFSVGLAYNKNVFSRSGLPPPKAWGDLWTLAGALRGKVAIPDIVHTAGMDLFLVALARAGKSLGDEGAIAAAIAEVQKLQAGEVYLSSIQSAERLGRGDLGLLVTYNSRAFGKELDGAPVEWVTPTDKGFGHVTAISITKGCRHRDLAVAYINAAVSPAVQIAQSLDAPYGPSNTLTFDILGEYPEVARRFPLGPADMAQLQIPDWESVNTHRAAIEAAWREAFPR